MSYTIFEQLSVFGRTEREVDLLSDMSDGIFPSGIYFDEEECMLIKGDSVLHITEISEKQKNTVISFVNSSLSTKKSPLINKSNIAYYLFDYCINECNTRREANKLARRLISKYKRNQISNSNILFNGKIVGIIGIEPRSLLSKSDKSNYGSHATSKSIKS